MFKNNRLRSFHSSLFMVILTLLTVQFANAESIKAKGSDGVQLEFQVLERFERPWAMAFLPDGRSLVTEKAGQMYLITSEGKKHRTVANIPIVTMRGQGGLGDIVVHPDFDKNQVVFLSYVERDPKDDSLSGAVVEKAKLIDLDSSPKLSERQIIWRQAPKVTGNGHYSHRIAIAPDGHLFITSGERQKFSPSQNMAMNLGKIVRIRQDGSIPEDNPFFGNGDITEQIWSLGHRNPLGIAFDAKGRLWAHEMGPKHGDELNLIERAKNYGYPVVSQGDHYSGVKIPNHEDIPIYQSPKAFWVPAISPAGMVIYQGDKFKDWQGNALIGGLSSQALVRVELSDSNNRIEAKEVARYEWGQRVREIEQNQAGDLYILEDGESGRLLKLSVR